MGRFTIIQGQLEALSSVSNFNANELASLCGISVRQLQRYFRQHYQSTPQRWLDDRRLLAAKELLVAGEPVKKVAVDLGFKHASHFCRKFKRCNKITPSEFAESQIERCRSQLTNVGQSQSTSLESNGATFENAIVHKE